MEGLITENIDIPLEKEKIFLKGSVYFTSDTPERAPYIINCAGLLDHRESYFVKYYSEKFAKAGYYVLAYDYRAHGKTAKQTGKRWDKMLPKIFEDIHAVITWILTYQKDRLLEDKIILFGRSLGGAIILTHGFIDERAKRLIALCTRYDYHTVKLRFTEEDVQKISPMNFLKPDPKNNRRILIAHCKDDPRIPFENVILIKNKLELNEENVIVYEEGGHSFKTHREDIFRCSIEFLQKL